MLHIITVFRNNSDGIDLIYSYFTGDVAETLNS